VQIVYIFISCLIAQIKINLQTSHSMRYKIDMHLVSSRFTWFKIIKTGFLVNLVDHLAIPSETVDDLFISDENLGICKNWSTDYPY
jgi:hypothetical protein